MNAIPIKWLEQQVNSKDTKSAVAAWRVLEAWKKEQEENTKLEVVARRVLEAWKKEKEAR